MFMEYKRLMRYNISASFIIFQQNFNFYLCGLKLLHTTVNFLTLTSSVSPNMIYFVRSFSIITRAYNKAYCYRRRSKL